MSRPVAARARRSALIVASVPLRDEAQHLDVRHPLAHQLASVDLELGRNAEARAVAPSSRRSASSTTAARVAEHERPPRQHVVDVFVAVDVPDARAPRRARRRTARRRRRGTRAPASSRRRERAPRARAISCARAAVRACRRSPAEAPDRRTHHRQRPRARRGAPLGGDHDAQQRRRGSRTSSSIPSITHVDDRARRERLGALDVRDAVDVVGLPDGARPAPRRPRRGRSSCAPCDR